MSTIHKGTIRAYDVGTHTASVQLTGSLSHYLAAIRVATNIPAAAVVVGRECTLLALDPNNPTDALVLSIQGALPPPGGGGVTDHPLLTNLGYATAGHTGFCALAGAQTITGEKLIDTAVGLRFGHAAGPLLQGPAAGNLLTLTGQQQISGPVGLWDTTPGAATALRIAPTSFPTTWAGIDISPTVQTGVVLYEGLKMYPNIFLATGAVATALAGVVTFRIPSGTTNVLAYGLSFSAMAGGGGGAATIDQLVGAAIKIGPGCTAPLAYTLAQTLRVCRPTSAYYATIQTLAAIDIEEATPGTGTIIDAYSLRIADITRGTNRRLIEAGPATPNLRLLANAPPNAGLATEGDSQLFLGCMENAAVNLRRLRWRQQSSLLATDKVLIAA